MPERSDTTDDAPERESTTRRGFLAAAASMAGMGGCSVLGDDAPTVPEGRRTPVDPDTMVESGVYDDEAVAGPGDKFEYRPTAAVVHTRIPREWVAYFPREWRTSDEGVPDYLRPRAGWSVAVVVMEATNVSNRESPVPPAKTTRFAVHEQRDDARAVWRATPDLMVRPPTDRSDLPSYTTGLRSHASPRGGTRGFSQPGPASGGPVSPGDSVHGHYVAEVPQDAALSALSPLLGEAHPVQNHTGGEQLQFPARWRFDFSTGETLDSTNQ